MATFYTGVDKERYDAGEKFLPQNRFLLDYTTPTTNVEEEVTTSYGIPNTNAFTNSGGGGGGGGGGPFDPYTAQSSEDYITHRTNRGNTGYIRGAEPEENYMNKIGGMIKTGIGMAIPGGNFLMGLAENQSRQNRLNATENAFIDMQLANQEQNIHGMGNLTNQDRYGFNKESMFGNYSDKVKERAEIARQFAEDNKHDPKYKTRPIDAYYLEKEKELEGIDKQVEWNDWAHQRYTANKIRAGAFTDPDTGKSIYDGTNIHGGDETPTTTDQNQTGDGSGGIDLSSSRPDRGRSRKEGQTGKIEGGHHFRSGGRAGYNRGRVVNPGGYAGDEEGGILEWIKSKMGSESETNPTVFGTQNSLLNQGSIAQLQDVIKTYEALMHMGDLDEEQQADYELKLNQLSALTEGATQKAHGGRVGLRYGGLLSIL